MVWWSCREFLESVLPSVIWVTIISSNTIVQSGIQILWKYFFQLHMKYSIKLWCWSSFCTDYWKVLSGAVFPFGSLVSLLILYIYIIFYSSSKMTYCKNHIFTVLSTCLNASMLEANLFLRCFGTISWLKEGKKCLLPSFHLYLLCLLQWFFFFNF